MGLNQICQGWRELSTFYKPLGINIFLYLHVDPINFTEQLGHLFVIVSSSSQAEEERP